MADEADRRVRLRPAAAVDAGPVADIYRPYVVGSAVSFETEAPDEAEMRARMQAGAGLYPWLVAEEEGRILGYAHAAAFRSRPAYRFAVETSVYLRPDACGRGLGALLYRPLIDILTAQGFTQAIGAIALPNAMSVRLHERLGFRRAGVYDQVGWKLGEWRDVGLWQRALAPQRTPPAEPLPLSGILSSVLP